MVWTRESANAGVDLLLHDTYYVLQGGVLSIFQGWAS